jgi:hypothetical protein
MVFIAGSLVDAGRAGFGIKVSEAALLLLIVRGVVVELDVVEELPAGYSSAFTTKESLLVVVWEECSRLSWTTITLSASVDVFHCSDDFYVCRAVSSFFPQKIYFNIMELKSLHAY